MGLVPVLSARRTTVVRQGGVERVPPVRPRRIARRGRRLAGERSRAVMTLASPVALAPGVSELASAPGANASGLATDFHASTDLPPRDRLLDLTHGGSRLCARNHVCRKMSRQIKMLAEHHSDVDVPKCPKMSHLEKDPTSYLREGCVAISAQRF